MDPQAAYKFCPICAEEFKLSAENLLTCQKCQFRYYISPKPCNACILENEKGEILVVRRAIDPGKGLLDLPGGFVDLNETGEAAMIREIKEETGLDIKEINYFGSYPERYLYSGVNNFLLAMSFYGKVSSQEKLAAIDDVAESFFVAKSKIRLEDFAFESIRSFIKDYLAKPS